MANPFIYSLTDTRWTSGVTTYNGIWLEVNNGAAGSAVGASGSRLLKFTNNTVEVFGVNLQGSLKVTSPNLATTNPHTITQNWTGTGTYTGIVFNVATDSGPSNAASRLQALQVGGSDVFVIRKGGGIDIGTGAFAFDPASGAQFSLYTTAKLGWSSGGVSIGGAIDTILTRAAAATLQHGAADAAAPVAQTITFQSVVAGTSNVAGANTTIKASRGTGSGASGNIIFQVAPSGAAATVQNTYVTALTLDGTTTLVKIGIGTTAYSQMNWGTTSVAPTSPNNGDMWFDGTNFKAQVGGVTKTFTLV